jgi:hypothetical protein
MQHAISGRLHFRVAGFGKGMFSLFEGVERQESNYSMPGGQLVAATGTVSRQ